MGQLRAQAEQGFVVTAVAGCHRGDGRKTVLLTLARELSRHHIKVAMVDADLSVDAAGRLWGLKRQTVIQLLRSDTMRPPSHVKQWLDTHRPRRQHTDLHRASAQRRVLEGEDDPEERAALQDPSTH